MRELLKYFTNPSNNYIAVLRNVIRYTARTKSRSLIFKAVDGAAVLAASANALFANNENRASTQRMLIQLDGTSIAWQSIKQRLGTKSTTETEFYTLSHTAEELLAI